MKKKNDTFAQAIVGLFMVTVLLLLGYFTIVISGVDILSGRQKVQLTATFSQVGGLKDHDSVMYRGTKVGTVEKVSVTASNLVVTALINSDVIMREGYRVQVCNLSMLGGNYMLLVEGEGSELPIVGTVFVGDTPNDWMSDVSRIARNLRDITERLYAAGIVTNLEAASASAKAIAERVERGEGLLGKLTAGNDEVYGDVKVTVSNACEISKLLNRHKIYDNLDVTVKNAKEITERLNRQQLYDQLDAAIADFRKTCASVEKAGDSVAKAGDELAVAGEKLGIRDTVAKFNSLADNLNEVARRLKEGEGTLGKLTSEDKLYTEVDALIRDCRQVLDNYRDTTPISTFSSLATGAL